MNILNQYINQIILMLILALAAWLGAQAKNLYRKYIDNEIKQNVCRTVVRFVEQVYIDLHGQDKLLQAMKRASAILKEYGIEISDTELVAMIEAAVNEFNNAFGKDDAQGRHELPGTAVLQKKPEIREPDPETGGTATLEEILADLKDVE